MYLIQTVQTSWRPQLPLPKELDGSDDHSSVVVVDATRPHTPDSSNMERHKKDTHSLQSSSNASNSASQQKKWSFGRLFRRKKEIVSDSSSEEDRKAGFLPAQKYQRGSAVSVASQSHTHNNNVKTKPKSKANRNSSISKLNGNGFDHIVMHQPQQQQQQQLPAKVAPHVDHEFFLPVETISPREAYYQNQQQLQPPTLQSSQHHMQQPSAQPLYTRSSNSLDRRAARAAYKTRSAQRLPQEPGAAPHSSSEEELISLNSSTFSKYRSDESIHSGGQGGAAGNNGQSRRSRAARNERYYKRLSRDGEPSHGQVPVMYAPQPTQRWKTQPVPLSIYNGPPNNVRQQPQQMIANPPQLSAATAQRLRNTGSLQHVAPYVQWGQLQQQQQQHKPLQNTVNDAKRSISYDSHIHLQNASGRQQTKPMPPPPPPRDPLRRVNASSHQLQNGSSGDLRPISYAFDQNQNGLPVLPPTIRTTTGLSGRCVSDDKIWSGQMPHYQSVHSLNAPMTQHQQQAQAPTAQPTHSRRFITRAERDAHPSKKSLPNGIDFHYVADATPRSRKPIHMLDPSPNLVAGVACDPPSSGILRTTKSGLPSPSPLPKPAPTNPSDYWQRLHEGAQHPRRGREGERVYADNKAKPRSISSSRVGELRTYPIPMYSEVQKPQRKPQATPPQNSPSRDEVDNVVCGSLHIKSNRDSNNSNYVEIRNKDFNKSNSMPNHYQRRSGEIPNTPNKYDEYVAEKRELHHKPIFNPPTPPQRKLSIPPSTGNVPIYFPRKKPANLEEAINELEAIYKSLGLAEEPEKKERVPTPSEFEKYALAHADEYDDEDSPTGEPDPIRDDVAYRNMQLANLQHKTVEKQPPFGIPVGPIVPSAQSDYLHVTPIVEPSHVLASSPDVIKDDLAVRMLRKDPPGPKEKYNYPYSSFQLQQKKNRATRTQSANIYNLIQRDAAKPSGGGDIYSYLELTKNVDRSGSMSDLQKDNTAADIPATLTLLRNLKEQEQQQQQQQHQLGTPKKAQIPFRHPSQGGAISQLPEKLPSSLAKQEESVHKAPVPLPRKSLTPEPTGVNAQMEDALNKIAKDAQESSVKLTRELQELRKEALITAARPKANAEEAKLEQDLQEIEAVSEAAKRCGKLLLDTLPDADEIPAAQPRKLHKEGKLIQAIDQVSEAANAVCEKILKDIVTVEPPVVVQEAIQVKNNNKTTTTTTSTATEPLVMPNLIKKLDPIQSEKIEAIAKRCMRQLSELADENPDYDNLNQELQQSTATAAAASALVACNAEHTTTSAGTNDNIVSTVAEAKQTQAHMTAAKRNIEEIDQIMQECEEKVRAQGGASERTLANNNHKSSTQLAAASSSDERTTAPSMSSSGSSGAAAFAAAAKIGPITAKRISGVATTSSTTASSFSSSSDCLAKSSSPSAASRRRQSSSITSFNPYSSSDYIKSPSSEYHAPSTDPIKTFSTTSYDVQSSSATPNITTNSTFSYSPSPPLNLTPVSARARTLANANANVSAAAGEIASHTSSTQERTRARSSSPSQYNSSEELAMIFGIEEAPKAKRSLVAAPQTQEQPSADADVANKTYSNNNNEHDNVVSGNAEDVSKMMLTASHATTFMASSASASVCATIATTTTTATANNHAYADPLLVAPPPLSAQQNTNPKAAIVIAAAQTATNNKTPVNVVNLNIDHDVVNDYNVDVAALVCNAVDASSFTTIINSNTTNTPTTNHKTSHTTITNNSNSTITKTYMDIDVNSDLDFVNTNNTITTNNTTTTTINTINKHPSTSLSPNSVSNCKLATIPESQAGIYQREEPLTQSTAKLSPNFNKIYASQISILVEERNTMALRQCESLSSNVKNKQDDDDHVDPDAEETSSNPDSGNVSLADFPLCAQIMNPLTQNAACLELQSACNSRFALKNTYVSEIAIEPMLMRGTNSEKCIEDERSLVESESTLASDDFPPLPSEAELLQSLCDNTEPNSLDLWTNDSTDKSYSTLQRTLSDCVTESYESPRKRSIVIETPQLNMNISELRINYELTPDATAAAIAAAAIETEASQNLLAQINQCTAEVEKLSEALDQLPRRRTLTTHTQSQQQDEEQDANVEQSLMPWRCQQFAGTSKRNNNSSSNGSSSSCSRSQCVDALESQNCCSLTSPTTVSVFGELRPANSLTTLEHVLMACSLGVITPTDLYTLCLIIIGMITLIAIVLF